MSATLDPAQAKSLRDGLAPSLAGCARATELLLADIDGLDDVVLARPSRLEGWSVAHVLNHLARNADSFVRILHGAGAGESLAQYAGGAEQRRADIQIGVGRPAPAIVNDVRVSAGRLAEAFADAPVQAWASAGRRMDGSPFPCAALPLARWREVAVHHADLGLGYSTEEWPAEFVDAELPAALAGLAGRLRDGDERRRLLAFVYGRTEALPTLVIDPL